METLSIFDRFIGSNREARWPMDREAQGELAVDVLDSVQTIVDVLVDSGQDYRVGFAPEATAYTDFSTKRIAITAKPLTQGGRPLAQTLAILTGFAVHEVGHARLDDAISAEIGRLWPGKVTPQRLSNTIQDVRLERAIVARFPGLAGVFDPTMDWVADEDRKHGAPAVYAYGTSLDDRLNFVGAIARYRKYVTIATDQVTQDEEAWWSAWVARITGSTTDAELLDMLREGLDHIKAGSEKREPKPNLPPKPGPEGTPTKGEGEGEGGSSPGDPDDDEPDDDDADADGGDTEGEGDGDGEGEGDDADGDDAGKGEDKPGKGEDKGTDGDGDGTEGEGKDEGKGESGGDTDDPASYKDMTEGESLDRVESDRTMSETGSGGSGKAITEATNEGEPDVDEGLDRSKLRPTPDDINREGQDYMVNINAENERNAERLDAGAFGKLKVRVRY